MFFLEKLKNTLNGSIKVVESLHITRNSLVNEAIFL